MTNTFEHSNLFGRIYLTKEGKRWKKGNCRRSAFFDFNGFSGVSRCVVHIELGTKTRPFAYRLLPCVPPSRHALFHARFIHVGAIRDPGLYLSSPSRVRVQRNTQPLERTTYYACMVNLGNSMGTCPYGGDRRAQRAFHLVSGEARESTTSPTVSKTPSTRDDRYLRRLFHPRCLALTYRNTYYVFRAQRRSRQKP